MTLHLFFKSVLSIARLCLVAHAHLQVCEEQLKDMKADSQDFQKRKAQEVCGWLLSCNCADGPRFPARQPELTLRTHAGRYLRSSLLAMSASWLCCLGHLTVPSSQCRHNKGGRAGGLGHQVITLHLCLGSALHTTVLLVPLCMCLHILRVPVPMCACRCTRRKHSVTQQTREQTLRVGEQMMLLTEQSSCSKVFVNGTRRLAGCRKS